MYLVLKRRDGRDIGVDADGTERVNLRHAELFGTRDDAEQVAARFGGQVASESRVFGDDIDDADWQD